MQNLRPASPSNAQQSPQQQRDPQQQVVPFVVGSTEGAMLGSTPISYVMSAAQQNFNNQELPPTGFLRGFWLRMSAVTAGNVAATAFKADGPWAAIQNFRFMDISSNPLITDMGGFDLYLMNLLGGYWPIQDPAQYRNYSAITGAVANGGSFTTQLWIPIEVVGREAFGALANMAANSTFRWSMNADMAANVYAVPPTTLPTVAVTVLPESWNKPSDTFQGRAVMPTPPNNDTTQYWTKNNFTFAGAGQVQQKLTRVGFSIRNLVFVFRDAFGNRLTDAAMPDTFELAIDNKSIKLADIGWWINNTAQRSQLAGSQLPSGVIDLSYCHDEGMRKGNEIKTLYLPTSEATVMTVRYTPKATHTLTVLTNDLAITR